MTQRECPGAVAVVLAARDDANLVLGGTVRDLDRNVRQLIRICQGRRDEHAGVGLTVQRVDLRRGNLAGIDRDRRRIDSVGLLGGNHVSD